METYQTYSGRVRNGQPVISGSAILPENASVFVTVLGTVTSTELQDKNRSDLNDHKQAHLEFLAAIAAINDEPLDDEFDAILAKRVNITRELDL
jgi:hypothetical protein